MSDRLSVSLSDGVADVRLNRPDKLNALDRHMFAALVETAAALRSEESLRAVVLSGEGRAFCAGLDFASFMAMGDSAETETSDSNASGSELGAVAEGRITHHAQQACFGWTELPVPVIVAIEGVALGGGAQLALAGDIRIMASDAKISILEIRWGLIPDMTGTQRLVELVGLDVAKELTFTGRNVEGAEALRLGLATKISDSPRDAALGLASEIASKSPHAIRAAKRLFNTATKVSQAEGFANERAEISKLIGSPNQAEAIQAYFEKRPPAFANPSSAG